MLFKKSRQMNIFEKTQVFHFIYLVFTIQNNDDAFTYRNLSGYLVFTLCFHGIVKNGFIQYARCVSTLRSFLIFIQNIRADDKYCCVEDDSKVRKFFFYNCSSTKWGTRKNSWHCRQSVNMTILVGAYFILERCKIIYFVYIHHK